MLVIPVFLHEVEPALVVKVAAMVETWVKAQVHSLPEWLMVKKKNKNSMEVQQQDAFISGH